MEEFRSAVGSNNKIRFGTQCRQQPFRWRVAMGYDEGTNGCLLSAEVALRRLRSSVLLRSAPKVRLNHSPNTTFALWPG